MNASSRRAPFAVQLNKLVLILSHKGSEEFRQSLVLVCVKGCGLDSERTSNESSVEIVQDGGEKGQNKKCCNGEKQSPPVRTEHYLGHMMLARQRTVILSRW